MTAPVAYQLIKSTDLEKFNSYNPETKEIKERCCICFENVTGLGKKRRLAHINPTSPNKLIDLVHKKCIKNWIMDHPSCPACRIPIAPLKSNKKVEVVNTQPNNRPQRNRTEQSHRSETHYIISACFIGAIIGMVYQLSQHDNSTIKVASVIALSLLASKLFARPRNFSVIAGTTIALLVFGYIMSSNVISPTTICSAVGVGVPAAKKITDYLKSFQ